MNQEQFDQSMAILQSCARIINTTNIAKNKSAKASSNFDSNSTASKALDEKFLIQHW